MDLDVDPFLTVVSCTIDEVYQQHCAAMKSVRPQGAGAQ